MAKFYTLTIKELLKETHNSVSISFDIPNSLKSIFSFIPGQYVTVQTQLNGEQIRRDYSICTAQNADEIRIGVKAVEGGKFSQYATSELKVGDELEIAPPKGRFNLHIDSNNAKHYIAFAAGSGITPILSMIRSVLEIEAQSTFVLVFGNKTVDDVMFKQDLDALSKAYPDRFMLHYVFSQSSSEQQLSGRINAALVSSMLYKEHANLNFDDYFICGPEAMINTVRDTLNDKGIKNENIHIELFTVSQEDEEVSDAPENLSGETTIKVLLDDEEETFTMPKKSTILEQVLLQGMDAPYSCQGGICSTCIAQVVKGKAIMEKNSILNEDEVDEGLILTCQAHPVTDEIEIDYDNV